MKNKFSLIIFLFAIQVFVIQKCIAQNIPDSKDYIPDDLTSNVTIKVNFHFMQHSAIDPRNFTATDDGAGDVSMNAYTYSAGMLQQVNASWASNAAMNLPVGNSTPVLNKKIQFVLKGVYFHIDPVGYKSLNGNLAVNPESEINVFFVGKDFPARNACADVAVFGVATTWGKYPIVEMNGHWAKYMMCFKNSNNPQATFSDGYITLAHELGHILSLSHTVRQPGGSCDNVEDYCDDTPFRPDMLAQNGYDPCCANGCAGTPSQYVSNNLMDYNGNVLTPEQLGRCFYTITHNLRNYIDEDYCSPNFPINLITINSTETVKGRRLLKENLSVANNSILTLDCDLEVRTNHWFYVNAGAKMVVNGIIKSCDNCSPINYNISGIVEVNAASFFIPRNSIINVDGLLEIKTKEGVTIGDGVVFNISPSGSVIINGIDYGDYIVNHQTHGPNYLPLVNLEIPAGYYYATDHVDVLGNAYNSGNVTLESGREITLRPNFHAVPNFNAKIYHYLSESNLNALCPTLKTSENADAEINLMKDISESFSFTIYPNPSDGHFSLTVEEEFIGSQLKVIDIVGKEVFNGAVQGSRIDISLNVQPGIYFAMIVKGEKIESKKISVY